MKIAILTNLIQDYTGHINIGDVFIRFGLQHILNEALKPERIEWHLISRFSKLSQQDLNTMKSCDFIIYGGMPQYNNLDDWKLYYDDEIWDDLNELNVPILRLAGGGGYPSEFWTPQEFSDHLNKSELTKMVLQKSLLHTKLITTRDKMAQAFLDSQNVESTLLPCSGTFACRFRGVEKTDNTINAICLTAAYFEHREDRDRLVEEFKKTKEYLELKTGKPCLYFAQVKKSDLSHLKEWFGNHIVHVDNAMDIIDYYKHVEYCVTTRLHFGLPIHGIGGKVVLVRVDTRAIAGEELDIPVIPLTDYTHEKYVEIFENDKFSKETTSLQRSIDFYKRFFTK
ncbi:MAG: hypothetical protein CVT92_02395 [Bacteroidetes bacterium HGW-Bacteroidetes-1]|jgi:hypothetical protein|nr:MAG: hypothetical protein CVT92_02395 [Bacteroidetes bacterium HGW-Bacteroidetes-1]